MNGALNGDNPLYRKRAGQKICYIRSDVKGSQFEGANPFCLLNGRMDASWDTTKSLSSAGYDFS